MYQQNEEAMGRLIKENEKLKTENERLAHMSAYHGKFQELRREYEIAMQNLGLAKGEVEHLNSELEKSIRKTTILVQKLKAEQKLTGEHEEKLVLLKEKLSDKEDEFSKSMIHWKNRE